MPFVGGYYVKAENEIDIVKFLTDNLQDLEGVPILKYILNPSRQVIELCVKSDLINLQFIDSNDIDENIQLLMLAHEDYLNYVKLVKNPCLQLINSMAHDLDRAFCPVNMDKLPTNMITKLLEKNKTLIRHLHDKTVINEQIKINPNLNDYCI